MIHSERNHLNSYKKSFAIFTEKRTLAHAMRDADVFIGVSGPNLVNAEMVSTMAKNAILFALSNPVPEIMPEEVWRVRDDLIIATGRSDYPNQVNNVLCFPYLFRGALDVRAHTINEAMQVAAVHAIKDLTKEPVPSEVLAAYGVERSFSFGPAYLLPKPMDPRLKTKVAAAVADAAIKSGVAGSKYLK